MKELTNRQKQARATKKKIAMVFMEMSRKKDISDITIAEICKAASVSVGTFYHYFKSKEEVLVDYYYDFDNILKNVLGEENNQKSIIEQILFVAEKYHEFVVGQELSFALNAYRMHLIVGQPYLSDKTRFFYMTINCIAESWINSGKLKHEWAVDDLTEFILRYIRGIVFDWISRGGNYDLIKLGKKELTIILTGLEN